MLEHQRLPGEVAGVISSGTSGVSAGRMATSVSARSGVIRSRASSTGSITSARSIEFCSTPSMLSRVGMFETKQAC
jgi:hypothetical protein